MIQICVDMMNGSSMDFEVETFEEATEGLKEIEEEYGRVGRAYYYPEGSDDQVDIYNRFAE